MVTVERESAPLFPIFRLQAGGEEIAPPRGQNSAFGSFKVFISAYVSCVKYEAVAQCVPRARLAIAISNGTCTGTIQCLKMNKVFEMKIVSSYAVSASWICTEKTHHYC